MSPGNFHFRFHLGGCASAAWPSPCSPSLSKRAACCSRRNCNNPPTHTHTSCLSLLPLDHPPPTLISFFTESTQVNVIPYFKKIHFSITIFRCTALSDRCAELQISLQGKAQHLCLTCCSMEIISQHTDAAPLFKRRWAWRMSFFLSFRAFLCQRATFPSLET